jgi:hypothetical protein
MLGSRYVLGMATALLHLESELGPGADVDGFSDWCDHHHTEILAVPGFLRARRFVQLWPGASTTRLLTLYDLLDAAVLDSDAYAAHGRDHTPLPDALAAALTFTRSVWTSLAPRDRAAVGDAVVWERSGPDEAVGGRVPPADVEAGVIDVRRFVAAERGDDGAALTLIEVRSVDDLDDALRARSAAAPGSTRRAYRQVFHAAV